MLIRREVYIINNFLIKIFIKIDIIKFEEIILNINKNLLISSHINYFKFRYL